MNVIKPPHPLPTTLGDKPILFLGGSIEMGAASMWQDRFIAALSNENVLILNPRRDDWDASWSHDPTSGTPFHGQVEWELDGQDIADIIVYYFDPNTKSPITLLELGLYATLCKAVHVYCSEEFWRYGNVKIVCDRWDISVYKDEDELIKAVKHFLEDAKDC